jgi:hypothetical protein
MRTYDKAATKITYGTRNDYDHDGIRNTPVGMNTNIPSGGPFWERRPSFASSADHTRASAYPQPTGSTPRMTTIDPKLASRRMSYMGGESLEELRAKRRELENIIAHRLGEVPQSPTMQDKRASMNFHTAIDPEFHERLEALKYQKAMEYQQQMDRLRHRAGHVESTPLTAKGIHHHTGLQPGAEFRSTSRGNASNDGSARISAGHRINAIPERVSTSGDELRMRFDMMGGLEAEVGGHRLVINPTGEGSQAEVVFSGKRGTTSYYGTSRGSVTSESRLGRSTSVREKAARLAERERERDRGRGRGRERERERERRHERSHHREDVALDDDEQSSASADDYPTNRRTRTKRAETYTAERRAAEEQSETERPKKGHRRMKTSDARYAAGPSSPTSGRGKRNFVG